MQTFLTFLEMRRANLGGRKKIGMAIPPFKKRKVRAIALRNLLAVAATLDAFNKISDWSTQSPQYFWCLHNLGLADCLPYIRMPRILEPKIKASKLGDVKFQQPPCVRPHGQVV